MSERITKTRFTEAMGREPEDDDLERANCPDAGTFAHDGCGWHVETNMPMWNVDPRLRN